MKKVSLLIMIFMLTFSIAFSQEETNKPNAFLSYMKGRSTIGFNFMPSFNTLGINLALDHFGTPIASDMVSDIFSGLTNNIPAPYTVNEPELDSKFVGFGMIFSYEFIVTPYLVLAVDAGFVTSSFDLDIKGGGGSASLKYDIVPYSVGIKFFTGRNAPWGFYLYPKIGGTVFNATASYNYDTRDLEGLPSIPPGTLGTPNIPHEDGSETYSFSSHGLYTSFEIGWRIQLFPKRGKDWPVQIGIDIALFDIGYYFILWVPTIDGQSPIPDQYAPLASLKFLPIPKLGFTIRF